MVIKFLSSSTKLSTKFIMLIKVKMPTIVGVLTVISMINTSSTVWKQEIFIFQNFSIYEQLKFHAKLSWAWKKFNLGAWSASVKKPQTLAVLSMVLSLSKSLTLCILVTPKWCTFANSEVPDEKWHNATFHQGLHCLLRQKRSSEKEIHFYLEVITCDPGPFQVNCIKP